MFEGRLAIGVVANQGSVVRIEGNTIENMGGVSLSLHPTPSTLRNHFKKMAEPTLTIAAGYHRQHDQLFDDSLELLRRELPTFPELELHCS